VLEIIQQAALGVWLLAVLRLLQQYAMQGFIHSLVEVSKIEQQGVIQL
jgi:hypothetical protein